MSTRWPAHVKRTAVRGGLPAGCRRPRSGGSRARRRQGSRRRRAPTRRLRSTSTSTAKPKESAQNGTAGSMEERLDHVTVGSVAAASRSRRLPRGRRAGARATSEPLRRSRQREAVARRAQDQPASASAVSGEADDALHGESAVDAPASARVRGAPQDQIPKKSPQRLGVERSAQSRLRTTARCGCVITPAGRGRRRTRPAAASANGVNDMPRPKTAFAARARLVVAGTRGAAAARSPSARRRERRPDPPPVLAAARSPPPASATSTTPNAQIETERTSCAPRATAPSAAQSARCR